MKYHLLGIGKRVLDKLKQYGRIVKNLMYEMKWIYYLTNNYSNL
jgi:hypothetical protein